MTRIASIIPAFGQGLRDCVAPRYRPEKHYMRGPGPACAARAHRMGEF
jgi:hypothetical protein